MEAETCSRIIIYLWNYCIFIFVLLLEQMFWTSQVCFTKSWRYIYFIRKSLKYIVDKVCGYTGHISLWPVLPHIVIFSTQYSEGYSKVCCNWGCCVPRVLPTVSQERRISLKWTDFIYKKTNWLCWDAVCKSIAVLYVLFVSE